MCTLTTPAGRENNLTQVEPNYLEVAQAITAYKEVLRLWIAIEEASRTGTGATWPPSQEYGAGAQGIIEGIMRRNFQLAG